MTLVVNLVAGPGTGKSTTAAGTFFELKQAGINCEYVQEYAKDVVWGRTTATLDNQIYIFAKQYHRIFRLLGQVDVVVTDCPIFMSLYYGKDLTETFKDLVRETFNSMDNLTIFLEREKAYNPAGRLQTEQKAREIDDHLYNLLLVNQVPFFKRWANREAPKEIANLICQRLSYTGAERVSYTG